MRACALTQLLMATVGAASSASWEIARRPVQRECSPGDASSVSLIHVSWSPWRAACSPRTACTLHAIASPAPRSGLPPSPVHRDANRSDGPGRFEHRSRCADGRRSRHRAHRVGHIFVIVLENQGYDSTFGRPSAAPYLADTLVHAENYSASTMASPTTVCPTTSR